MERAEIFSSIYNEQREETRLTRSRHGQLEYLTTMDYIHKLVPNGSKVLEVGAGTGRYSIALAREGYDVTAVELVASNLEVLQKNADGLKNIVSYQGDAVDLRHFADNSFDAVFVLGPMYHLFEKAEQHRALDEAIRVAKPHGVIMIAFISVYQIMYSHYLSGNFRAGFEENFDTDFRVKHYKEQGSQGSIFKSLKRCLPISPCRRSPLQAQTAYWSLPNKRPLFVCPTKILSCLPTTT